MKQCDVNNTSIICRIQNWESKHPYVFSCIVSSIIVMYALFRSPSLEISDEDAIPTDNIQFVNIDTIQAPKRVVKKEISTEESDVSEDTTNVERAVGTSDDENAVDIAFFPNIAPPKPVSRLKKLYPKTAKEMDIEATVNVELLISANGKVKNVKILGIRLSKALPTEMSTKLTKAFSRDAFKILYGAQFSPPIVNGKQVPIKMEMPLKFRLT